MLSQKTDRTMDRNEGLESIADSREDLGLRVFTSGNLMCQTNKTSYRFYFADKIPMLATQ